MRQQQVTTTQPRLYSMSAQSAQIQIVATGRGLVLDLQCENIGTDGIFRKCHAVAKLALDEAARLESVLSQAVDAAWGIDDVLTERNDVRQTALWSPASFTEPHRRAA